jgi:FAD-linked oxidoreductase
MWRNWAGNQTMSPASTERPATVEAVQDLVRATGTQRLKAIGSGHSFTGIGLTDGVLVSLDRMDRVLDVDRASGRVTVQAGRVLSRLNDALSADGLGLTNMGDVAVQTVAGALATGTHGTGRDSAALATQVVGLELVLADGERLTCSADQHPDVFAAARVGLGALGIVTAVTLQAEPAFLLRAREEPRPLDEVLDGFEQLAEAEEHVEFYWFPHTSTALLKRNERVAGPAEPLPRARRLLDDEVLGNGAFALTCRLGAAVPRTVPALNRLAARAVTARTYSDAAPAVFTAPRRVRFREMEYAVPRAELPAVMRELRGLPERHGLRVSFPVEVRVAPADDVWLSTAYGRSTAYVAVHVYRGTELQPYFDAVEAVVRAAGGRPHWGKLHSLGAAELRPLYPRFDDVLAVRDRLDPGRRFTNAYLERVLGP